MFPILKAAFRLDICRWNDEFWRRHNRAFARGKEDFVAKVSPMSTKDTVLRKSSLI